MIDNPAHSLVFGSLTWIEEGANPPDADGVQYIVRPQDATFGTRLPLTTALLSLIRSGGPVAYDRTDNREPVWRVTVKADDSDLLAQGERALQLECEKTNTLTWTPPDGSGEPTVFDIVWSHLELVFDDTDELMGQRTYVVHMQALPDAHPVSTVVTQAVSGTPTYTLVDNGSATSGGGFSWALSPANGYTLSVVSGRLRATRTGTSTLHTTFVRTGSVNLTGARYIAFDVAISNAVLTSIVGGGGAIGNLASTIDLGSGVTRYIFAIQDAALNTTISSFTLQVDGTVPLPLTANYLEIDQVQTVDLLPFFGTARQRAMSLVPGGSVRTDGSIQVVSPTVALGKTLVYTHPTDGGYLPPLRPWRTSGNTVTPDATLLSGSREPIGAGSTVYRVPVTALPAGRVEFWAWLRVTSGSLTRAPAYAIRAVMNGVALSTSGGNYSIVFSALNTWQLCVLGSAIMPPIGLGPSGFVQFDINENSGQVDIDEAYMFATDLGSLTVVDCGTGTLSAGGPSNRLWIDAPSLDQPAGGIYRGNAADRSDAWHAGAVADVWGTHEFDPLGTSVFVASQNATDAATSLEHYRRFNTYVAREV